MKRAAVFVVLAVVALGGCGLFLPPSEYPVIENSVGGTGVLAVRAERRVAYVDKRTGHFCAEPSPDVSEAFANTMKLVVEAEAKKGPVSVDAGIDFQKALATSVSPLMVRSQGVQLFRDGAFALCQMQRNKEKEFFEKWRERGGDPDAKREAARREEAEQMHFSNLLANATALILVELDSIAEARRQLAQANVAPAISMSGSNSTVTINGPVGQTAPAAGEAPAKPGPKTPDNAAAKTGAKAAVQQTAAKADEKAKKEKAKAQPAKETTQ